MIKILDLNEAAVITKDKQYTYQELLQLIEKFSLLFKEKNYRKVAIYSENRVEWIAAFYAGWQNNCIVIPIDFMASADDVSYIINDSKPDLVFSSPNLNKQVEEVKQNINHQPEIITFNEVELPDVDYTAEWKEPENIDNTAVIIYTSGTTGSPKGVMLSFKNIIANLKGVSEKVEIYKEDRQVLMLLPLHHVFPLVGSMMAPLFVGSTIVMSPSMQSSDLLETLKKNKVAIMIGVPRLYELIYRSIKSKIDASGIGRLFYRLVKLSGSKKLGKKIFKKVHDNFGGSLQFLVSGGAALPKHVGELFQTLGFDVLEGFGMTEASPMITFTRPGKVKIGSPGQPLPGIQVEIRDGEIVAKGDNIMQGYLNRPEETAEVLKEGWLHTGDLGYLDKNNFLFITGRKKDIIVLSSGKNVNPVVLEQDFQKKFEEVQEAGVFLHKNHLHIAILPNLEILSKLNVQDIEGYFKHEVLPVFNAKLSAYKRIMKFAIVNSELPRTRLGKIQRFKLAEHAETSSGKPEVHDFEPTEFYLAVKNFIETQIDFDIRPDHHIEFDLGLDSLNKLSLIDYIEKSFGVKMDEKKLINFPSVSHLSEYIKEKSQWFRQETTSWADALKEKVDMKLPKSWPTQNIFKSLAKYFFKIYFRFRGEGAENVPKGPCIIAPNHQSFIDGLFVASFLRRRVFKETYFYAKKKHVNNKLLRFLARTNNVIVMDMEKNLKESIQKMAIALKEGKKIIIFPEGTRTKTGELGEFKKTFAILSTELNVPVVPVAIDGADRALPAGKKLPRPWTRVKVKFLEPIYPKGHTPETLVDGVQEIIEDNLTKSAS